MRLSVLESRILERVSAECAEPHAIKEQIRRASVIERDYTGVGLYSKLSIPEDCPRLSTADAERLSAPLCFHMSHPEVAGGGGFILWVSEGRADTIECFTYEGIWPSEEGSFVVESPS